MLCLSGFELYSRWVPLIWAQCFGQGHVSRPLPLNPTNSSSARLLEEKEFFPFQGKSLNPRKLGPREIFNKHSIENVSHICPAMFTMTMIFNLRAEFLRALYESSDVYEVCTKNSAEVHVR